MKCKQSNQNLVEPTDKVVKQKTKKFIILQIYMQQIVFFFTETKPCIKTSEKICTQKSDINALMRIEHITNNGNNLIN